MTDITLSTAARELSDAPSEKQFHVHMNGAISSLKELAGSLEAMPEDTFKYHVSSEKNDFANWVRDVFRDESLAKSLSKSRNKNKMASLVKKKIESLEAVKNIDKYGSGYAVRSAIIDFAIGIIVGFIIGVIITASV